MTRAVQIAELGDQNVFTVDSDNSRIGIGTTNPQALLQVGTGVSVYGNSGIVSATTYYGSGAELTGITGGATLSAASGSQRVVVTSLTSGSMTAAGTDADFAWNSTTNTLSATNISVSGTLTYEDVTNVDSVGLITARSGLRVVGGGLTVTGVSSFFSNVLVGGSAGAVGSKVNIFNGSDADNILGITGADESSEYAAIGVNGGNAVITGGGAGSNSAGIVFRTASSGTEAEVARLDSSGRLLLGTTVEGFEYADNFTLADSGNCGITIRSGTTSYGSIYFSDATSGGGEYIGVIEYNHSNNVMKFNAGGGPKLSLNPGTEGKTAEITGNLFVSGVATATAYHGDGSNLTGIAVGITTTKYSPTANAIIQIGLGTAQHHELTLTAGFTTITTSGGSMGESHSLVLIQPSSGIATVGFSTFFQFPSGATPSMSEGSSKVDLVSFVVKDIAGNTGTGATELLASAGLNYS